MLFSQRQGIKPIKNTIQIKSMDKELKNSIWNALKLYYWDIIRGNYISEFADMNTLFISLWVNYFKEPLDTLDYYWPNTYENIRDRFFQKYVWFEFYDFIDFIANHYPEKLHNEKFMVYCNTILERELSGYRFVGNEIRPLTSEEEIAEIEEVLKINDTLKPVKTHIKRALELFSDRKNPDYRNSIKESISAVGSLCKLIADDQKASLGSALKIIETTGKIQLHGALKSAFEKLYGYTSDENGIRHSLIYESNLDFEDAKFMLVSCSTFINYLIVKSQKADIKL